MIKTFLKYNWKGLLWALFILFLCAIPGSDIPKFNLLDLFGIDKIGHAFVFAVLVVLGCKGLQQQYDVQQKRSKVAIPIMLFAILYAILTEWLQGTVFVERSADLLDMIANWIGSLIGLLLYSRYFKKRSEAKMAPNV